MQLDDVATLYKEIRDLILNEDLEASNAEKIAILCLIKNELLDDLNRRIHNVSE